METSEQRAYYRQDAQLVLDDRQFATSLNCTGQASRVLRLLADVDAAQSRIEALEQALREAAEHLWNYGANEAARDAEKLLSPTDAKAKYVEELEKLLKRAERMMGRSEQEVRWLTEYDKLLQEIATEEVGK